MSRAAAVVIALSLSAPCLAGVGPEILVPEDPRTPQVQVRPQVAYGGGVHLVVWQSGLGRKADIRSARLDAEGRVLDSRSMAVCTAPGRQGEPAVAFSGGVFLVVWSDRRSGEDDVYAARLDSDGRVLDPDGFLLAGGPENQSQPAVAAVGDGFWVAYTQWVGRGYAPRLVRTDGTGRPLDAQPTVVSEIDPPPDGPENLAGNAVIAVCNRPRLAVGGQEVIVLWEGGGAGRFLNGRYHVYGRRYSTDGTAIDPEPVEIFKPQSRVFVPDAAAEGGAFLVVWEDRRDRGELGGDGNLMRFTASGAELVSISPSGGGRKVFEPAMAVDTRGGLLLAFRDSGGRDGMLILRQGLDNTSAAETEIGTDAHWPALCAPGSDAAPAVLAYTRTPTPAEPSARVVVRLVTE